MGLFYQGVPMQHPTTGETKGFCKEVANGRFEFPHELIKLISILAVALLDRNLTTRFYLLPSKPVRLQACSRPQETNMEYGLEINGKFCASAKSITSCGGVFPRTKTTAPTPATMAVRITWTVVSPVSSMHPSDNPARMSLIRSLAPQVVISFSKWLLPTRILASKVLTTSESFMKTVQKII
jgi:hypothetical protein